MTVIASIEQQGKLKPQQRTKMPNVLSEALTAKNSCRLKYAEQFIYFRKIKSRNHLEIPPQKSHMLLTLLQSDHLKNCL